MELWESASCAAVGSAVRFASANHGSAACNVLRQALAETRRLEDEDLAAVGEIVDAYRDELPTWPEVPKKGVGALPASNTCEACAPGP